MNKRQKEVQQTFLDNEKAVLKKLEESYKDALSEINSKLGLLMARQDADMQHVIYQIEYQKALKTQVQSILETLQTREFETVSEYLTQSYEDGFIGTMYDLQGQGIPLVFPIDQEQVVAAIQHETKLSENLYNSLGKDVKVLNKQIAAEISRGIATGMTYSEITRNIANYGKIPRNNAMRIARTEAHRIQCKASMDACEKAKSKGSDVVKQWDSSLDKRTRDSHVKLDGEIKELDEKFSNGLMYPGDPNGTAAEVINCRCALLQRARWALGNNYTKWSPDAPVMISDDGTTQLTVIEAKNYEDFKKKYNKAVECVRENVQKMNLESISFKNRKEAEKWFNTRGLEVNVNNFDLEYLNNIATFNNAFEHKFAGYMQESKRKLFKITGAKKRAGLGVANGCYTSNANTYEPSEIWLKHSKDISELKEVISENYKNKTYSNDDIMHVYAHEYGHYISDTLTLNNAELDQTKILRHTFNEMSKKHQDFPGFNLYRLPDVSEYVSTYGSANTDELFAELFSEYYTSEKPREMAKIFGDKLEEVLKKYNS